MLILFGGWFFLSADKTIINTFTEFTICYLFNYLSETLNVLKKLSLNFDIYEEGKIVA